MRLKKISLAIFIVIAALSALYVHAPAFLSKCLPKSWLSALHLKGGKAGAQKKQPIVGTYEGNNISANDWADPEGLRDRLFADIDAKLGGESSPDRVKAFMQDPANRLLVAQHALAHAEVKQVEKQRTANEGHQKTLDNLRSQLESSMKDLPAGTPLPPKIAARNAKIQERISAIEDELLAPHSMAALVSTKDPDSKPGALSASAALVERVSNNLDWAEQLISSGEMPDVGNALAIMDKISRKDPEMLCNQLNRDIATATAIEFSVSGWAQADAVRRAEYFIKNAKAGRLNSTFNSHPLWLRRLVCGLKGKGLVHGGGGNDRAGSVESMEYSLDNVHLPAYRYTGACWQAPYRLHNIYGDSIHGSAYHQPFQDVYGTNFNETTRTVGGVCGGLSHYGATTATANGVPALTSGEPGHCSYVVLVGDKWTPAYSLSWQRGMHWQVFRGNNKFSALHMATRLFSPEESEKTSLSQTMRHLGNAYAAASRPQEALRYHEQAVQAQPANFYAWRDYASCLAAQADADPEAWKNLCQKVNTLLAPAYPEMAAELLKSQVYPQLKKALGGDKAALQQAALGFWSGVQTMGPDADWDKAFHGRWDVEGLCQAQLNLLGINPQKDAAVQDVFRKLMGAVSSKADYAPVMLSWGNSLLEKMDKGLQSDFMAAMVGGIGQGAGATDADREKMLNPVILAAEKTSDITSFQAIGKTLPEKYRNPAGKVNPPNDFSADPIVSRGGIIQASSTSGHDNPCNHWGVLEPGVGGGFHTGKDNDAWVKVTLPKQAHVTGVVIQTTTGNLNRLNNMVVQVSETGADNDWKEVAQLGPCKQQTIRVDLKSTAPLAKYVRIVRKGGPDFFHLRAIFVYGKPAA